MPTFRSGVTLKQMFTQKIVQSSRKFVGNGILGQGLNIAVFRNLNYSPFFRYHDNEGVRAFSQSKRRAMPGPKFFYSFSGQRQVNSERPHPVSLDHRSAIMSGRRWVKNTL